MKRIQDVLNELATGSRLGKFISVGAIGSVIDLSVSWSLTLTAVLEPHWAKLIGAECAIVVMFLLNDTWTFDEQGRPGNRAKVRRLLKSNLVRSGGLVVQFVVVWVLVGIGVEVVVAGTDVWAVLTMPVAIAISFFVNYTAESLFTWNVSRTRERESRRL